MHIHRLHHDTHREFLAESRRDPITHEPLKAGDEIVICSNDQTAFLVDSWNGECPLCKNNRTLPYIPPTVSLDFRNGRHNGSHSTNNVDLSEIFAVLFWLSVTVAGGFWVYDNYSNPNELNRREYDNTSDNNVAETNEAPQKQPKIEKPLKKEKPASVYHQVELKSTKIDDCSGEWRYVLPEGLYAYLGSIRMRKADKSDTEILYRNTEVCVIGESYPPQGSEYSDPWSKINYNGRYYWVSSGYLVSHQVVFSDCGDLQSHSRTFAVTGADSLNVRQGINNLNHSRIIGVLAKNSIVCSIGYKVTEQSGWADEWIKTRLTNGDIGWVAKKYLQDN